MSRILIIDDQPSIVMLLRRVLQGAGYEVVGAENGSAGLDAARDQGVDAILTDLSMPGSPSGTELIRSLRTLRPDCPVAVISGFHSEECMAACRAVGVTDFVEKPFNLASIKSLVGTMLARRTSY